MPRLPINPKLLLLLAVVGFCLSVTSIANADSTSTCQTYTGSCSNDKVTPCGSGSDAYVPSIDIGCKGKGNPILDLTFALIRWLSDGVGFVVVASIIVGGIQYSSSQGDPQATAKAKTRIQSSLIALLIFVFGYGILNYLIPDGLLR